MDDMRLIADVAKENDLLVLADEIYTRYLYKGVFVPMRTLPGMEARTVTLNSFSKNFMMTGWRVGFIIAPREIVDAIGFPARRHPCAVPAGGDTGNVHHPV